MRVLRSFLFLLALLAAGLPVAQAVEKAGPYHENKRWGYRVRAPTNWKRRAVRIDETWIADKFFPSYSLRARDGIAGGVVESKPQMWVIGFPRERVEDQGVERKKIDEHTTLITVKNPYRDYKDFVKRESWAATGSGGWFFSREEDIQRDGIEVTVYEIQVEKLVRAPLRIVAWVYHLEDVDFAVQFRILEEHYASNKNVIEACLKSFKVIERTEAFPEAADPKPDLRTSPSGSGEQRARSVEEIYNERVAAITLRVEREADRLPKGWAVQKSKHFVLLSQIDKTHGKYVLNYAEEIRKYLDRNFSDIGPSNVPKGLIRVFSSSEEEHAYQQGTRGWWTDEVGEITMTYGAGASILSEFSWLAGRLTDQYFQIKNENLKSGMPSWIRHGIWTHIQWARPSKRKKMVLQAPPYVVRELARMFAAGTELRLGTLMTESLDGSVPSMGAGDPGGGPSAARGVQAASVVWWLLSRGNRGKMKNAVATYLEALDSIIAEEDKKFELSEEERWKAEAADQAAQEKARQGKSDEELEEEEDRRFRERRENRSEFSTALGEKYQAIRQRAFEAAFGGLTSKDWESIDRKWKKFAGG